MDYIVLDMEWNQPWPGSPSAKKVLPVAIRGEIIQIGAVRVTEEQTVADEFQILIKPKFLPAFKPPGQQTHRNQGNPPAGRRCTFPGGYGKFPRLVR